MQDFEGKTAVITGAASGIGRGLAAHCVKTGMNVVLADIEDTALRQAEQELKALGGRVLAVHTDVSKFNDVAALAQKTQSEFGFIHLLFNNAGVQSEVQRSKPLWEASMADWQWVTGVNLWGVIHSIKVFIPLMLEQKTEGYIVNTASQAGLTSGGEMGMYRFTKHGVVSLSETLYFQFKARSIPIGVSVLCTALVHTRLNDAERNRPSGLQNPQETAPLTPQQQALKNMFQAANEKGLPPAQYAEIVFDAIRQERLYVLESPMFKDAIRQRTEDILAGRNPGSNKS